MLQEFKQWIVSILWILAVIRDTISNSGTIEYSAAAEEGGEISGERALTLTLDPGHSALSTQGEVCSGQTHEQIRYRSVYKERNSINMKCWLH